MTVVNLVVVPPLYYAWLLIKLIQRFLMDVASYVYRRLVFLVGTIAFLIIVGWLLHYFNIQAPIPQF